MDEKKRKRSQGRIRQEGHGTARMRFMSDIRTDVGDKSKAAA